MNKIYTLHDLQELEDEAYKRALDLGLPVPEVLFHLVQAEEMYDIAARGLPGRYSHYQFGRTYEQMKGDYDRGKSRIYELVINTRPVYAYLMDGNSLIAQLLVIAHVMGHATMYENNKYFEPADKNILARVRGAAERIDSYMGEYGREKVEDFIDGCQALMYNRSYNLLAKPYVPGGPQWEDKKFDRLFPDETAKRREEYKAEKEAYRLKFPKEPQRDLLAFIEKHSRYLEDWQRDIISIVRTEYEYFIPSLRTKVLNEGVASFYHQEIVSHMMADDPRFTADDFMEFQSQNAGVLHPHIQAAAAFIDEDGEIHLHPHGDTKVVLCVGANPYLTGYTILMELKRLCEKPTEKEKERWAWAGEADFQEKRNEVIQVYDDAAFLSEFITRNVCEKAKLFVRPRTMEEYKDLHLADEEVDEVRELLTRQHTFFGTPVVEITDADYERKGWLYMVHRHDGVGLDDEYTRGVMPYVADLWGHRVIVETIDEIVKPGESRNKKPRPLWYYCYPNSTPQHSKTKPS